MVQVSDSTAELAALLNEPIDLDFQLPDPEDEEIQETDFEQLVDHAWRVCDRFDLQTDIWRGRILRVVRDREKKGGEGRGAGFLHWLKSREIGKSQAYSLIELANSADTLLIEGQLSHDAINNFSKRAFVETAKSAPEVQQMVTELAQQGDRITRREVKQMSDQWTAMSSELLPEEVKEKSAEGGLPSSYLAPLVKEMEKLPEIHLIPLQEAIATNPDVDTVKHVTSDARCLAKYLDASAQVQAINHTSLDMELALDEALRLDCLNTAADLVKQALALEQVVGKLYTTWKRLGSLSDRLYVDTGSSTPHLRLLLTCMDRLAGDVIEVPLDESGEQLIRLKVMTET